ncbi:MAG: hypothetical protein AVDCRST_MAG12-1350 [uncultured Rubrobacteraceae bacterium]|uniref:Uncharacterized protein n=1 Tax=uncultured Rubrobacteraceae bacterium TaxID=349277 RepID=A0A6J4RYB1_9ACTN|nr:MAG: hypothetical protein AVDCRST_MAG12-1350 [uncultured Rubrobacteraceae bacterium]
MQGERATGNRIPHLGFVLAALLGASGLLAAAPAHAAKASTVNSNLGSADLSVGDGVCDVLASGGERCTWRAAIQEANHPTNATDPAGNTSEFSVPKTVPRRR